MEKAAVPQLQQLGAACLLLQHGWNRPGSQPHNVYF